MAERINSAKVNNRRALRFRSIDEALQEIDRIVAAENAGKLSTLGNWTPGQNMGHVATWINYSYDGYPFSTFATPNCI